MSEFVRGINKVIDSRNWSETYRGLVLSTDPFTVRVDFGANFVDLPAEHIISVKPPFKHVNNYYGIAKNVVTFYDLPAEVDRGYEVGQEVAMTRIQGYSNMFEIRGVVERYGSYNSAPADDTSGTEFNFTELELDKTYSLPFDDGIDEYLFKFTPKVTKNSTFTLSSRGDSVVYTSGSDGKETKSEGLKIEFYEDEYMTRLIDSSDGQGNILMEAGKIYYVKVYRKEGI